MNRRVFRDNLTGVYNREYLLTQIPHIVNEKALAVLMLDVDDFKMINDTYGHAAGDIVLKTLTETIDRQLRKDKDYLIRYGGDEFVVLLSDMNELLAKEIIERLKKAIKENPAKYLDLEIPYNVSIGINMTTETDFELEKIIQMADESMYQAKRALRS